MTLSTKNLPFYLLATLLVASVIINVLQARKIEQLRYVEASLRADFQLQPNMTLPPIEAKSLDGKTVLFPYGDNELPSVIYVLSPTCKWCENNQSNVEALFKGLQAKYRFIAISLEEDGLKSYSEKKGLSFSVYSGLPESIKYAYRLSGTPQTIVVSSRGEVMKNWNGAYISNVKHEVESYFGITLPGLNEVKQ